MFFFGVQYASNFSINGLILSVSSSAKVNVLKISMPSLPTTCRNIAHCIDSSFVAAPDASLYSDRRCFHRFHVTVMLPPVITQEFSYRNVIEN